MVAICSGVAVWDDLCSVGSELTGDCPFYFLYPGVLSPELALFVHMMSGTHPSGAHTMFLSLLFFLLMIACGQTYANISRYPSTCGRGRHFTIMLIPVCSNLQV